MIAFLAGQSVIAISARVKGGAKEAREISRLAAPHRGCIYIYDGPPALYMLTHSCLPTKWAFPGQLNTQDEAYKQALGVEPAGELRRILASGPEVIIDTTPRFQFGNVLNRAILATALRDHYMLTGCVTSPLGVIRLVYRQKDGAPVRPVGCPSGMIP